MIRSEAQKAVSELLRHPIELTHEEIETAFGHKVKIVSKK